MPDLVLNARFLMRPMTGVDRVATELALALMRRGPPLGFSRLRARRPAGEIASAEARPASLLDITSPSPARFGSQVWEQLSLARADPQDWLLSPCNIGPIGRKRQIVIIHDAQVFRQPKAYSRAFRTWYRVAQPHLARTAAQILTVSEFSRGELAECGIADADKVGVVPNGADHILRTAPDAKTLTRHNLTPDGFILVIGSLAPHKNLARLAKAALARADRRMPLVIAGGGNPSVFAEAGIKPDPDLRFLGRITDAELRALYEAARALAIPSITEGFGLPAVEAMTCGCPVIASTGGALPEVCGDAALLVDPLDTGGWTAAMDLITEDDALAQDLRAAGLARAERFTWDSAAARLAEHLAPLAMH
ncbi:MAG: glycosyltransferase family 1 protein [Pseudomonadota bacterium]